MELRISVSHSVRDITLELDNDDKARDAARAAVEAALAGKSEVLWLKDKRGREVAVPAEKIAFVEFGAPDGERRLGFGA
jgi:hypothetical protein